MVTKFLGPESNKVHIRKTTHLEAGLEGELELRALDDDVGEIEEMDLEGVQHSLSGHYDLLGLLLHRQRSNQGRHLTRKRFNNF